MKKLALILFMFIAALIATGCASSRSYKHDMSLSSYGESYSETKSLSGMSDNVTTPEPRKIIYSAYLTLAVKNMDTASNQIIRIAEQFNGYVQQSGTYSVTIRVKSENLDMAVEDICLIGKVKSKNVAGQDVSEEYQDYQIRLENAEKARERYLELLARAENVEAALKVEKELERLNETIELYKGKINRIDHLTEFSTITVSLQEKKKPGIIGYVGLGLYYSVKWLFVRN
ncbi:MAG: DUF4349 domain-containing protein [Bacteroidales bacterium]|nr:DUF4349 domain-containing protein [Bacteroidales bacterium]HQP04591.1 DUF4349 domain-containing protein [Bacteroidales bacterium]